MMNSLSQVILTFGKLSKYGPKNKITTRMTILENTPYIFIKRKKLLFYFSPIF